MAPSALFLRGNKLRFVERRKRSVDKLKNEIGDDQLLSVQRPQVKLIGLLQMKNETATKSTVLAENHSLAALEISVGLKFRKFLLQILIKTSWFATKLIHRPLQRDLSTQLWQQLWRPYFSAAIWASSRKHIKESESHTTAFDASLSCDAAFVLDWKNVWEWADKRQRNSVSALAENTVKSSFGKQSYINENNIQI